MLTVGRNQGGPSEEGNGFCWTTTALSAAAAKSSTSQLRAEPRSLASVPPAT
ncbi:MAG: hypothetical protein U1E32_00850 [Rhodoglobus sp.]|nr:hypothetical protein [Rhodoglobus sp.]